MIIEHNGTIIREFNTRDAQEIIKQMQDIIQEIYDHGRVVKTIIIDGVDVTGLMEIYIESNLDHIKDIVIESVSPNEIIKNLYSDIVDYLKKVFDSTESISNQFYGEVDQKAWQNLGQLSEALQFSVESLKTIAAHSKYQDGEMKIPNEVDKYIKAVKKHVNEINHAIETQDTTMIGDIIKYELGQTVLQMLNTLLSREEQ